MNTCIPRNLDASTWEAVEPHFDELLARDVTTVAALEQWILDRSELEAACSEARANLYISMTCDTESSANVDAYMTFEREVVPRLRKIGFELDKRLVELEKACPLEAHRYEVLMRDTRADVEIFRPENIPLQTRCTELEQQYDSVIGAMMVEFDGSERTLPQMAKFQEATDRDVRERAWRTVADRRLADADRLDVIYDDLIALRDEMAKNAGFESYLGYNFKARHRFDYTPEDCREFHKAIEAVAVPFARRLDARRRADLGVEA
ncbi:MAG: hypothetical protein KDA28_11135, partial [Phycisphaerales bacterium]|nr:hypothetical protein [Phycisphaerales bacterium]